MTAADRIVAALSAHGADVRPGAHGSNRARCPAHDGSSNNSVNVTQIEGQALIHCFGGCGGPARNSPEP